MARKNLGTAGGKYGIAARVREERAKSGQVVPVEPGKGVTPEDAVKHGQMLLEHGRIRKRFSQFESTGRFSASDIFRCCSARARNWPPMPKSSRRSPVKRHTSTKPHLKPCPPGTPAARPCRPNGTAEGRLNRVKPTSKPARSPGCSGRIRTPRARNSTPAEADRAEEHANKVKTADEQAKAAQDELFKNIPKEKPKKPGAPENPKSDGNVWKKVREYIQQGKDDYKEVVGKVATDLAMPYQKMWSRPSRVIRPPNGWPMTFGPSN